MSTLDLFPPTPLPPHCRHNQPARPVRKRTNTRRAMYIDDRSVSELQRRILLSLRHASMTHDEIRERINALHRARYSQNNVRSRCSELHRKNVGDRLAWLIVAEDRRVCRVTGEIKNTWALTPLGRESLDRNHAQPTREQ